MLSNKVMLGVAVASSLVALAGCSDGASRSMGPSQPSATLIVSEPLPVPSSVSSSRGSSAALAVSTEAGLVYISLPSGSIPDGQLAIVRNPRLKIATAAVLVDGGFDPVRIAAAPGDSLVIEVTSPGGNLTRLTSVVPRSRPPKVVRTQPPRGKTDVPLNSRFGIVFSEPIQEATLASSVRLLRGDVVVAGTVSLVSGGTQAVFEPATLLAPNTAYRLEVTNGVRDLSGEALEAAVTADVTTGTSVEVLPASEVLDIEPITAFYGPGPRQDSAKFNFTIKNTSSYQDSVPNYPIFPWIAIRPNSKGSIFVADASNNSDFATFTALMTDGIDELLSANFAEWPAGDGGGWETLESIYFAGRPGPGPDFAGYTIDRVEFVIDSVSFASGFNLIGRVRVMGHPNSSGAQGVRIPSSAIRAPRSVEHVLKRPPK